jgi:hypothetical protein
MSKKRLPALVSLGTRRIVQVGPLEIIQERASLGPPFRVEDGREGETARKP